MRHEFHPEALAEYEAAAAYYAERDPRVGQRFVAAVEDVMDKILESPTRWRVLDPPDRLRAAGCEGPKSPNARATSGAS